MANQVSLTGNDTTKLDGRIFAGLADGDAVMIDIPNNLVEAETGKDGNTMFSKNASGENATVTIRLLIGSADDKYMNSRLAEYKNNSPGFRLFQGEFVKRVGDGQGNISNVIYTLAGGIIQKYPAAKDNQAGDNEQAVAVWQLFFPRIERKIA